MGNRTAERYFDASNTARLVHTRTFDSLGQLATDINAAGTAAVTSTYAYLDGNLQSVSAPLGRNTSSTYDRLNRLRQQYNPINGVTTFGYDADNDLTSVTDPRNLTTSYAYNGYGDLKTTTSPDTGVTTQTFDSGGNLFTSTDARGMSATYGYDALNRPISTVYKNGTVVDQTLTFTYDAGTNGKGRLTGAADANHSLSWTYDGLGRVIGKGQTIGTVTKSVGYGYANGNLASLVTPSGQTITYAYNTNHQISGISVNGTAVLNSVTYEPFGPVRGWTWGNGTVEVRNHDTDGNPAQMGGPELATYSLDNAARITGTTNSANSALSWTYGYDLLDRLTSAAKTGTTRGWTYDADGNRLTQTGTVAGTYTPSTTSNRLNTITGSPARTYTYDNAGSTLTYSTTTFTYYNSGRMKTAKVGSSTTTYLYNALGQRIKKSGGTAGTVLTVFDEAGHLVGEYSSTGVLVQETVWFGDTPVATIRPHTGGGIDVYYVHADHLNAPRIVTRPSDNKVAWRWDTDPFGTTAPNQNPQALGTFVYNLRYPGQYFDSETGLLYNMARDYDPATGRYVESDPIGLAGGIGTYNYASDRPVSSTDPTGQAETVTWCFGGPAACIAGVAAAGISVWMMTPAGKAAVKSTVDAVAKACSNNDDDSCDKVLDKSLLKRSGIYGQEHQVKADALGTNKSLSLFDLCGCNDGRVVVKAHGCKGPIISETDYRWK
jgi:RHS repeat-associated protein